MTWNKPSTEATNHRYIVAVVQEKDEEGEDYEELTLLSFNGINNRWRKKGEGNGNFMLKDILKWIPVPKF